MSSIFFYFHVFVCVCVIGIKKYTNKEFIIFHLRNMVSLLHCKEIVTDSLLITPVLPKKCKKALQTALAAKGLYNINILFLSFLLPVKGVM